MKKVLKQWFILSLVLLFTFSLPMEARAEGSRTTQIDAILLIDDSGSMMKSDPKQISTQAVSRFIDLCQVSGDKLSVVVYGEKIVRQTNLKEITSLDDKQSLKNIVVGTPRNSWTDLGIGLKKSIEIMDNGHDKNHKPIIVLLSDGKNMPQRDKKQAEDDKNNAVNTAKDKGYRIYTIGLNADGTVDKDELSAIATSTNGKFYSTDKADNLGNILNDIFADAVGSNTVTQPPIKGNGTVDIIIPNSNVVEANITIQPQDPNDFSFTLIDPDGKTQAIDNNRAYLSKSATYSMIKLITPKMGTWKLNINTGKDKVTNVSLLYNYDIQLALEVSPNSGVHKGDKVKINSYLISNGSRISNADALYKGLDAKLIVTNEDLHDVKDITLTNTGKDFEGELELNDNSNYSLVSKVETETFFRESPSIEIKTENRPPVISKNISSKRILFGKDVNNMPLGGLFSDPDGDNLTYSVSIDKPTLATLAVDGDSLKINTKKLGSTKITITANDGRGGVKDISLNLKIISMLNIVLLVLGILLAITIGTLLFVMRKRGNRRFTGEMKIVVRDDNTGRINPPQFRRLDNYKGKVNLHQLLQLKPEYKETEKIVFIPGRGDSLNIKNSSGCSIQKSGRNLEVPKGIELKDRDSVTINLTKIHESINIEYYIS